MIDSKIVANRMTPQPRRRIDPLVHDSYHRYRAVDDRAARLGL